MKKIIILFICFISVLFLSCNKHEEGFLINAELTGFKDSTKFYLYNSSTEEILDSAFVVDNQFVLKGQLTEVPEWLWLNTFIGSKRIFTNLFIGNEKITIKGDIKDFPYSLQISGSKIQEDQNLLQSLKSKYEIEKDSLLVFYYALPQEKKEEFHENIFNKFDSLDRQSLIINLGYIKAHTNTYPAVLNLEFMKYMLPKDTVEALYHKLNPELKSSRYGKAIKIFLDSPVAEIGNHYSDFEAKDKSGKNIKLSDFKGKYILLNFTAYNYDPCAQAAVLFREVMKIPHDSLTIVSFSGDLNKKLWLKSIERDSVSWVSLWDGKGRFSETLIKYGVQGYPTFFIIDPKGIIIDKWTGYEIDMVIEKIKKFLEFNKG